MIQVNYWFFRRQDEHYPFVLSYTSDGFPAWLGDNHLYANDRIPLVIHTIKDIDSSTFGDDYV